MKPIEQEEAEEDTAPGSRRHRPKGGAVDPAPPSPAGGNNGERVPKEIGRPATAKRGLRAASQKATAQVAAAGATGKAVSSKAVQAASTSTGRAASAARANLEKATQEALDLVGTAQGLLASNLASDLNGLLQEFVKGGATIYDKAMDAQYIETHVGGALHRLFDGGHTLTRAIAAGRDASAEDGIIQEALGTIQGLLRDGTTPMGLPVVTWNKATFDDVTKALESSFRIPKEWFYDFNTYDAAELLGSTVGAMALVLNWNRADAESFARMAGGLGLSGAVAANPALLLVTVVALARAYTEPGSRATSLPCSTASSGARWAPAVPLPPSCWWAWPGARPAWRSWRASPPASLPTGRPGRSAPCRSAVSSPRERRSLPNRRRRKPRSDRRRPQGSCRCPDLGRRTPLQTSPPHPLEHGPKRHVGRLRGDSNASHGALTETVGQATLRGAYDSAFLRGLPRRRPSLVQKYTALPLRRTWSVLPRASAAALSLRRIACVLSPSPGSRTPASPGLRSWMYPMYS